MKLDHKVAIITGASEGIGKAVTKLLSEEGVKVVLAARSKDKLEKAVEGLKDYLIVPTDMTKPNEIKNLVEQTIKKYGRVDILINNAGRGYYGPLEKIELDRYKELMSLNVYGPLVAMQEVIPYMRTQGVGAIVNISSRVSKNYLPGFTAYATTKYALNAMSYIARQELAADNIVVSVVYPKMTATNFGLNAINARKDDRATGMRAPGIDTAEDVAQKIVEVIKSGDPDISL